MGNCCVGKDRKDADEIEIVTSNPLSPTTYLLTKTSRPTYLPTLDTPRETPNKQHRISLLHTASFQSSKSLLITINIIDSCKKSRLQVEVLCVQTKLNRGAI